MKTVYGFTLVGVLVLVGVSFVVANWAANVNSTPSMDWIYDGIKMLGWVGILAGLGMFFFGSMKFSRG
jgi:FtsH-binding integral membrane protein